MVNYEVKVRKSEASVVDDVVSAIKNSNGTFGEFDITSVGKTGKISFISTNVFIKYMLFVIVRTPFYKWAKQMYYKYKLLALKQK